MITRSEKNKKIVKELDHTKTQKTAFTITKAVLIILAVVLFFFLYMRFVATSCLVVREYGILNNNIPDEFNGLKIVHFTDLYYGSTTNIQKLNNLVNNINKIKPDIVVFTGDLISKNYDLDNIKSEELISLLSRIEASVGKYAVSGENDKETFTNIMNNTDFKILENTHELIYRKGLDPILLIGIDDIDDVNKSFSYYNEERNNKDIYSIVLVHKPDLVEQMSEYSPDMVLAGHSLNGSIKIPFIGGLIRYSGSRTYYNEDYKINDTLLYVSGGIGSAYYNLRLFNRPSFNFYRLRNK